MSSFKKNRNSPLAFSAQKLQPPAYPIFLFGFKIIISGKEFLVDLIYSLLPLSTIITSMLSVQSEANMLS